LDVDPIARRARLYNNSGSIGDRVEASIRTPSSVSGAFNAHERRKRLSSPDRREEMAV
jgi:hypothetical protein